MKRLTFPAKAHPLIFSALAFGSGFGVLVLEVTGARILAGSYGLSSIPWTSVIAAVLGGLFVGNTVGGFAADREYLRLSPLYLAGAAWCLVPILGMGIPALLYRHVGFFGGALLSSTLYFAVPAILMGATTPILVQRQTRRVEEVGFRFGQVGAWSTVGAIVGGLVGGFVLLPTFPLPMTLALTAATFLLFAALAALEEGAPRQVMGTLLLIPVPLAVSFIPPVPPFTLYQGESLYASIRVAEEEWWDGVMVREFWQNGSLSSAEIVLTGEPAQRYQVVTMQLLADRIEEIGSVLILGGAGNSVPSALHRWRPELALTVVEVDPRTVDLSREFFSFGTLPEGAVEMVVQDARPFLRREDRTFDVILANAYDNLYSIPWHLVTREAYQEMEARLNPGGRLIVTLSTPVEGGGSIFLRRVVATLESVFPAVRVHLTSRGADLTRTQEVMIFAARDEADLSDSEVPWVDVPATGPPLRDDHAPVEFLMALRFFRDPGMR